MVVRACRSRHTLGGLASTPRPRPRLIPLLQRRFPGPYYSRQKTFNPRASPGEGRGRRWSGRRWIQGGRSEKSAPGKQLGAAAERGTSVTWRSRAPERGPGPARRGEGRVRRPPPRPTPSRGGREPGAGRGRSRRCLGAAGRGRRRPRSAAAAAAAEDSAGSSSLSVQCAPGVRGAPSGGRPARCGSSRRAFSGACLLYFPPRPTGCRAGGRVERESRARRWLPPFPPPRASPPRRWRGAGGSGGGRPAGAEGPRPRVRSEGRPAGGGKGTKAGGGRRGPAGRPWRRGGSRPLMNINRACGLARTGWARRPARVPAAPRRRASEAGPGGARRVSPLALGLSPGCPRSFWKVHIWAALAGRSRSLTRLWKGRRKQWSVGGGFLFPIFFLPRWPRGTGKTVSRRSLGRGN